MVHVHCMLEDLETMTTEVLSEFCDTCAKDDPKVSGFYTASVSVHLLFSVLSSRFF